MGQWLVRTRGGGMMGGGTMGRWHDGPLAGDARWADAPVGRVRGNAPVRRAPGRGGADSAS